MSDPARSTLQISAVSTVLGIPIPTIRSWERRYGFPAPARTQGKHRRYSLEEVELLRALRDEITHGHPAAEAVRIVTDRASGAGAERTSFIDAFVTAAMRMDQEGLRRRLDDATERLGIDAAVGTVALPGMRELGARWAAGTCDVSQEHLATEAVHAWLARLSAMTPPAMRRETIVLACGPKDLHSLGIEAFGLLLARRGWTVRTLGALTPASSLAHAIRTTSAVGAVVTSQRSVTRRAAIEAIEAAHAVPGTTAFYAGDAFASSSARRSVPGVYLGADVVEAVAVLERSLGASVAGARASA